MKSLTSSRFAFVAFAMVLLATMCALMPSESARAQAVHGINSDGNDFFVGLMPGIHHGGGFTNTQEADYFLIGSYQDNNQVIISYFTSGGVQVQAKTLILNKGMCQQVVIDHSSMFPTRPGEVLEYKAANIHSRYPISVQLYSDGSSCGSMYQAIPTPALGKSFVIAAFNDNPLQNNPGSINRDSSSSEFMIIAPYDNTSVTFTPNSTTFAGIVGVNSGAGSNGNPHPVTITMNRGQVYWVRSNPTDITDDMSGSTVVSNKPVAVLGGQERALLSDPSIWPTLDNDIRDIVVEEMTPVVDWGSDYPSIPTMPSSNPHVLHTGDGDMYRIYTNDPKGLSMNMWQYTSPAQQYGPNGVNLYQTPAEEFDNIMNPVDFVTASNSVDASGKLKKMYAVQYQYFQGHHDANVDTKTKKLDKGGLTLSSGGDSPLDENSYRSNNEMNLVPIDRWRLSTVFMVPKNSFYHGFQFVGIITNKDSLRKIFITKDNGATGSLGTFIPPVEQYQIPLHPELIGLTLKLPSGSYVITGNTPFVNYSYGRTEDEYKDIWGYAAPTGQAYGSRDQPNAPSAEITPSCGQWHVRVYESDQGGKGGIADVMLLNDPSGFYARPPRVSTNCRLNGSGSVPTDPTSPPFVVGDDSLSFDIQVAVPSLPADAYIYVVDIAGNDTVIHLHYVPTAFAISRDTISFPLTQAGATQVSTFTFHVVSTGNYPSIQVPPGVLEHLDPNANDFTITSNPTLPATLSVGDSVVFTITFSSADTNRHFDKLDLVTGCLNDTIPLIGQQATPIIIAGDWNFGTVAVGDTVCKNISVQNVGRWNLILDSNYAQSLDTTDYTFEGPIPDTIKQGASKIVRFCFHPSSTGSSNSQMNWGTNLNGLYARDKKDTTVLLGYGTAPGMSWDIHVDTLTVECESYDTVRRYLVNTSSGTKGASITVKELKVIGPDSNDVTILDYGGTPFSSFQSFVLQENTSIPVDLQFKPTLANGFSNRYANVVANGTATADANTKFTDTINCTGFVRHAIVTVTPASYDFGPQTPDTSVTHTFTITNTGDTAFVISGLNLTSPDFTILSGPTVGSSLQPGATDTFVLQYTAKHLGGVSTTTITVTGDDSACNRASSYSRGLSEGVAVLESSLAYSNTYICHNNSDSLTVSNVGTAGVILDSVQIIDSNQMTPAASQFVFVSDSSQLLTWPNGIGLDTAQTVSFPVRFTPVYKSTVVAQVVYYWEDTSRGQHRYFQEIRTIKGIGYQTVDTISLSKPAAASNIYTAVTANQVAMPVQLVLPFDTIAQVYGMKFTLRYYRDAFQYLTVQPRGDLKLVSADTSIDPTNSNDQLLTIDLASNSSSPILESGTVATVNLKYVIGKDSISPFDVKDVMFLDNAGASVCWVANGAVPTSFYGQNLCGDATLRMYLHGGMAAFSIQDIEPNPIAQTANVDYTVAQDGVPVTMQVFNALGQPIATLMQNEPHAKGSYRTTLDASLFPSGLYTIFVSTPGFGISKQIVVTK